MIVSHDLRIIAASADAALAQHIQRSLLGEHDWLLIVTERLNRDEPRSEVIAAAMKAWSGSGLTVVCVDGAEIPLGLRDMPKIAWQTPEQDGTFGAAVDMYSDTRRSMNDFVEVRAVVLGRGFDDPVDPPPPRATLIEHDMPRLESVQSARPSTWLSGILLVLVIVVPLLWLLWYWLGSADGAAGSSRRIPWTMIIFVLATLLALAAMAAVARGVGRRVTQRQRAVVPEHVSRTPERGSVFISYSHKDGAVAEELAAEIERQGRAAWIYQQQMAGGATGWAAQIVQALRQAQAVMLVASRASFGSDQVVREMYLAMDLGKPIIPIMVEDAELPDDFLYILAKFQRHQMTPPLSQLVARALASA